MCLHACVAEEMNSAVFMGEELSLLQETVVPEPEADSTTELGITHTEPPQLWDTANVRTVHTHRLAQAVFY